MLKKNVRLKLVLKKVGGNLKYYYLYIMIFTSASMLNRWGTPSTTGVGVRNHRVKKIKASHRTVPTLYLLKIPKYHNP